MSAIKGWSSQIDGARYSGRVLELSKDVWFCDMMLEKIISGQEPYYTDRGRKQAIIRYKKKRARAAEAVIDQARREDWARLERYREQANGLV